MSRNAWITGLLMCATLTGSRTAAAQTPTESIVHVQIMNAAGVPADTLERAQTAATRVFQLSGITLVWVDVKACQASCLIVRIVTQPVNTKSRNRNMLGLALSTKEARGTNLWIFYPHIQAFSALLGMQASQLLGHVMAHEMGHLLLPNGAHASTGVMRQEWDKTQAKNAATGLLTFTPDEASVIRERLRASASPLAHAHNERTAAPTLITQLNP
jgi:hypothetical protein